jgi:hypothetical protein
VSVAVFPNPSKPTIVKTSGESKLRTLRKRKRSLDDNGNELPGILTENNTIEMPYCEGYIKNVQISNDKLYGDVIVKMKEKVDFTETTESKYETIKELWVTINKENEVFSFEGTIDNPIKDITFDVNQTISHGTTASTENSVKNFIENDSNLKLVNLTNKLIFYTENNYPNILCCKQDYKFIYNVMYKKNNIILTEIKVISGTIYITYDNPKIEIEYVIGGELKKEGDKLKLNEDSPFNISEEFYYLWDGKGIWYKETYPLKKNCISLFKINNKTLG